MYKKNRFSEIQRGHWLTEELKSISESVFPFDIKIICRDGTAHFHRTILAPLSPYLARIIKEHAEMLGQEEIVSILIPDVDLQETVTFSQLIYSGRGICSSSTVVQKLKDLTKLLKLRPIPVSVHDPKDFPVEDDTPKVTDIAMEGTPDPGVQSIISGESSLAATEVFTDELDEMFVEIGDDFPKIVENSAPSTTDQILIVKLDSSQELEKISTKSRETYKCDVCDTDVFQKVVELKDHLRQVHKIDKPFKCDICNARFKKKVSLQDHLQNHQRVAKFCCPYCQKKFNTKKKCLDHQKRHGDRNYSCQDCGAAFKQRSVLFQHRMTQHKPNRFSCPECSKTFSTKQNYEVHSRTHTGETPFSCSICQTSFKRVHHFHQHIKSFSHLEKIAQLKNDGKSVPSELDPGLEAKKEIYFCDICPYTAGFHSKYHLQKHRESRKHQQIADVLETDDQGAIPGKIIEEILLHTEVLPNEAEILFHTGETYKDNEILLLSDN